MLLQFCKQHALFFLWRDLIFGFQSAISANVPNVDFPAGHHARNEEVPMTNGRVFFAAHHGHSVQGGLALQPRNASQKHGRLCHAVIQGVAGVVEEVFACGPAAKLAPRNK